MNIDISGCVKHIFLHANGINKAWHYDLIIQVHVCNRYIYNLNMGQKWIITVNYCTDVELHM